MDENLPSLLDEFQAIHLDEMNAVKLMNRIDRKYVTSIQVLPKLLKEMKEWFRVQETDGKRISSYHTTYLDTEDYAMYLAHHNSRLNRQKIRVREYENTHDLFLEIKRKNNHGRTRKKRIALSSMPELNSTEAPHFREEGFGTFWAKYADYAESELRAHLENRFQRITLVNLNQTERVTLDFGLNFHNLRTGLSAAMEGLVVIEVKQDGNAESSAKEILSKFRIRPRGFSKYCIGAVLTNPDLKRHRFMPKIRRIQKIIHNLPENSSGTH